MSLTLDALKKADEQNRKEETAGGTAATAAAGATAAATPTSPPAATPTSPIGATPAPTAPPTSTPAPTSPPSAVSGRPPTSIPAPTSPPISTPAPTAPPGLGGVKSGISLAGGATPPPQTPQAAKVPPPVSGGGIGVPPKLSGGVSLPAGVSPGILPGASAPSQSTNGGIDFDGIAGGGAGEGGGERPEAVEAARVFRAGEETQSGGSGRRWVVGVLALLLVVGGGGGVLVSGIIPGVSIVSIMNLLGRSQSTQVAERTSAGPVLEAISGEDAALSLPRPVVDVQSGIVEFTGFDSADDALDTPQSRRELAEQIRGFVQDAEEDDLFLEEEDDLQILGLGIDGEEAEFLEEEDADQIRTAENSRSRKQELDSRTPSDRILSQAIVSNAQEEIVIVQSSDADAAESGAESGAAESGESESEGAATESESASAESAKEEKEEIQVRPSLEGADRRRMLNDAARLYSGGAFAEAEALYRNVLAANATNRDGLRGLALVAVATGRYQLAVATYLKILEYYPNDPVAVADLTNLHGVSGESFYAIESALKNVLGDHPEWDSRLHFALGNLYAGEERWLDAQRSYFNAYSGEQGNPDYAYNLAVVLDYLNKPELAAQYYNEALALAENAPSGFDAAQVRARIAQISQ